MIQYENEPISKLQYAASDVDQITETMVRDLKGLTKAALIELSNHPEPS